MDVLKQYKESSGYFVQVIITSDGQVLGYGGIDDGDSNKEIENITKEIVTNKNISDKDLQKIQDIKSNFGLGHVVIKAPNGDYGVAMGDKHFKGHLEKGDYLSIPNRYKYARFGTLDDNNTHPVESAIQLAASDVFGLNRRDIMTYHYQPINNNTYSGAKIDLFVSNDDGSMHGQNNGNSADNFYFNNKFHNKTEILAPEKMYVGSQMFGSTHQNDQYLIIASIIIICLRHYKKKSQKR